jgi:predicted TPR repeat methyltransferase
VEGIRWGELEARAVDVICHNVAGCQRLYPGQPWDWLAESGDREGALAAYRQALEWKPGDEGIAAKIWALGGISLEGSNDREIILDYLCKGGIFEKDKGR